MLKEIKYKSVHPSSPLDTQAISAICKTCAFKPVCLPEIQTKIEPDGTKINEVTGAKTDSTVCKLPLLI